MVKVGFITEGHTEKIIIKSDAFQEFLTQNGLLFTHEVIVAEGNNNLTESKAASNVAILRDKGVEIIFILRDVDDALCVVDARNKVMQASDIQPCVAVKAMEAWFLADTKAMRSIIEKSDFHEEFPETIDNPFERINILSREFRNQKRRGNQERGVSDKKILARNMLRCHFSIENAANHPNCPSAKYFIEKLKSVSQK